MSARSKHMSSAQVTQPKGSIGREVPKRRAPANGSVGASRRQQRAKYQARRRLARWDLILLFLGVVVVALVVGSSLIGEITTPKGKVAAAQTNYDFGNVPIRGGLITTRFPLAVEGDARAVDIVST
jgi:hypothetical protein